MSLKRDTINIDEFKAIIADSEIIVDRKKWPKVIRKGDEYVKIFNYAGKNIHRQLLNPIATQFVRNAERIHRLKIKTITPSYWARCKEAGCDLVRYPSVPGRTVYNAFDSDQNLSLLTHLAEYVAELHGKNFYFRHGHSDNYLVQDDGTFAIIDMDNVRYSMNLRRRAKNLLYLIYHAQRNNRDLFQKYGILKFLNHYFDAAGCSESDRTSILDNLRNHSEFIME